MLALWTVPGVVGLVTVDAFHFRSPIEPYAWVVIGASFSVGWLAGLGEEAGWTAYLLPRLAPHIGKSRALVVAGAIRGLWHWPVLVGPLIWQLAAGEKSLGLVLVLSVVFAVQLIISNALFGSLFGWVWYRTESLPLMGWLHQWYDATRDVTSLLIIGFGASLWFKMLWAIPFYLVAAWVLMRVAEEEGAKLWALAPTVEKR
jgi:membrane protease YdiL (CAAX protease family)